MATGTEITTEKVELKPETVYTCATCGEEKLEVITNLENDKKSIRVLPSGWAKKAHQPYCQKCKSDFRVSVIKIPVAEVLEVNRPDEKFKKIKDQFWSDLRVVTSQAHKAANVVLQELFKCEELPNGRESKVAKFQPDKAILQRVKVRFPDFHSETVSGIYRKTVSLYSRKRFELFYTLQSAKLSTKNFPFMTTGRAVKMGWMNETDDVPVLTLPLRVVAPRKAAVYRLRLRGGYDYRRQAGGLKNIINGTYHLAEVSIHIKKGNPSARRACNRKTMAMVHLTVGIPSSSKKKKEGLMYVKTTKDSLLTASRSTSGNKCWTVSGNELEKWARTFQAKILRNNKHEWARIDPTGNFKIVVGKLMQQSRDYDRRRATFQDDLKFEKRFKGSGLYSLMNRESTKHENRVKAFVHQVTTAIANYADRSGVSKVVYDDICKDYTAHFPWFSLKTHLGNKLSAKGIEFEVVEPPEPESSKKKKAKKTAKVKAVDMTGGRTLEKETDNLETTSGKRASVRAESKANRDVESLVKKRKKSDAEISLLV